MKTRALLLTLAVLSLVILIRKSLAAPLPPAYWPREFATLEGHPRGSYLETLVFSPDNKLLASGAARDRNVRLWRVADGKCLAVLKHFSDSSNLPLSDVQALAFGPDGTILATGGADRLIKLWEVPSGKHLATLEGHQKPRAAGAGGILALAFKPDGKILASLADDETVRFWSIEEKKQQALYRLPEAVLPFHAIVYDKSDRPPLIGYCGVFAGPDMGTFAVRRAGTDELPVYCRGQINVPYNRFYFSADGKVGVSMDQDNRGHMARVWNTVTGENIAKFDFPPRLRGGRAALTSDGKLLACDYAWDGSNLRLYEISSGRILGTREDQDSISSLAFSPDKRVLAAGCFNTIKLWRLPERFKEKKEK